MRLRLAVAALGAAALIAVIGVVVATRSADDSATSTIRREAPLAPEPEPPAPVPVGDPLAGATVFAQAGCGNCHTLAAAGSTGAIGPVLDGRRADYARILEQVTNGGGGMPAYAGTLSDSELQDVAAFTFDAIVPTR
ncbi:MAG: c-type cytochrome [Gaiellaceae bacterium]